ncbi:MAG: aminopeptidase [Lachnospiraceae bacterium]|nr:aminopeptidase [Lachnospiraceae bacterium]
MDKKNLWSIRRKELFDVDKFAEEYKLFISRCKTERECVAEFVEYAKAKGFKDLKDVIAKGETLVPGSRVYAQHMGKTLMLYVVGTEDIEAGMNITGAHIDSPRLDLKPNPLYEDSDLALFETHYYGGIKKYQWVAIPLALHGVVCKRNGETIPVTIGESPKDPVLGVSDLLIHLAQKQMDKKAKEVIDGEDLNAMAGSIPVEGEEKDAVKKHILNILSEKYNFDEKDFLSAELTLVPAGPARDYGIDRGMIMAYGQDDRVCAYPAVRAITELGTPRHTCACVLTDKEEIGSIGATGAESRFFENSVAELMFAMGQYSELKLRRVLQNSQMLSADVTAAFDPNYPETMEKNNCAYAGHGLAFNKYCGAGGKFSSSDANAEFIARIRRIMDDANVNYEISELGRVDVGGGGTIAYVMGNYGMDVIDCGVPVFNMHAPWEICSKIDLYETRKGYGAFYEY